MAEGRDIQEWLLEEREGKEEVRSKRGTWYDCLKVSP